MLLLGIVFTLPLLFLPSLFFISWVIFVIILVVFRRPRVKYKDSVPNSTEIILSPVTGKVIDVTYQIKNPQACEDFCNLIRISTSWIGPYGLYLPFSCEVNNYEEQEGKKFWRGSKQIKNLSVIKKNNILIENKLGHKLLIQLLRCSMGGDSQVWARPGDKARSAACFGYIPFGGTTLLTLPSNGDILVKIGDKVKAGETVIAGLKGA